MDALFENGRHVVPGEDESAQNLLLERCLGLNGEKQWEQIKA
jgi:hypothetical protein